MRPAVNTTLAASQPATQSGARSWGWMRQKAKFSTVKNSDRVPIPTSARMEDGMDMDDLSPRASLARPSLSLAEHGPEPRLRAHLTICFHVGLPIVDLLHKENASWYAPPLAIYHAPP